MIFDLQKAPFLKRLSAYMFDVIIFLILVAGFAFLLSFITKYDVKLDELAAHYDRYEEEYGIDISEMQDYESLSDEDKAKFDKANEAFSKDEAVGRSLTLVVNTTLIIVSMSTLLGYLILEFAVPLFLKNGQTLGKKIFSIALMRDDHVKVTPVMMFVRSIIGKYAVETMAPIFLLMLFLFANAGIIPLFVILLLLMLQIFLYFKTKTNSFIHDVLAYTVAVDMQSQMIFDSTEEMMECKNRLHAEEVSEQKYF